MTQITVSATKTDEDNGEWIDIASHAGRLMSTLMADGQPFTMTVTDDGRTIVTPLNTQANAASSADDDEQGGGTSSENKESTERITSRATLYKAFKSKLKTNIDERNTGKKH